MEKEKSIKILQDIIKIKTDNQNEEEIALYFKDLLKEHGIESELVEYSEGRASLVAEIENGEGSTLGISGHMDVVNAGNEENWIHPPYSGHIEDDVIWGRGASDMKSGLAALVIAFIDTYESKNFNGKIKLMATVGEEIGELGAGQLTDKGYADDLDALLIAEPCNVAAAYAHKGTLNYKLISKGVAAHSSTPETGVNAIDNLIDVINEVNKKVNEKIAETENKELGKSLHNITLINGGTQINSIPDYVEYEANARTIPEYSNDDIINDVKEIIERFNEDEKYDLDLEVTANLGPVEAKKDSKLIQSIIESVDNYEDLKPANLIKSMEKVLDTDLSYAGKILGDTSKINPITISGTTDAAQFIRANENIEFAVYGPGIPVLNHKINERLPLSQYLGFIEVYKMIFEKYLS